MKCLAVGPRTLEHALGLAPWLLEVAAQDVVLAVSEVRGPAVVLGRSQRAGRVLDLGACAQRGVRVLRRQSAGTAAYVGPGRSLHLALALPHVAALERDATPANLLNRNVRGFLQGFARAGAAAHYTGREWIGVRHRPVAVLGFDVDSSGRVLIELVAGVDEPALVLPEGLERGATPRRGREPIALREAAPSLAASDDAVAFAERVVHGFCARFDAAREPLDAPMGSNARVVADGHDPVPAGLTPGEPVPCPIGVCEAAASASGGAWLGGDALASRAWLDAAAAALAAGGTLAFDPTVALEGARVADFVEAFARARRAC